MSPRRHNRGRRNGNATNGAAANGAAANGASSDAAGPVIADAPKATLAAGSNGSNGAGRPAAAAPANGAVRPSGSPPTVAPRRPSRPVTPVAAQPVDGDGADEAPSRHSGCTLAQLRRFIKSRPYVPVHELRRRFLIEGVEDEVNSVATDKGVLYVGLPAIEAHHLSELIKAGEVGYELLLDPTSPAVIGVFPMRPVARQ